MKNRRSKASGKSTSSSSSGKKNRSEARPQTKGSAKTKKPARIRIARKPAKVSASPAETSLHPVLAATVTAVTAYASCSNEVIGCIQQQSGGEDISDNPSLAKIHVDGGLLARCINLALGVTKYSSTDFPPSSTVQDCINKVCGYTS